MKVQEVKVNEKTRYMLLDSEGMPVQLVIKYLKYLDDIGKAENTLKAYCYHLKLYYEFLEEMKLDNKNVDLNVLAKFVVWLRNPHQSTKIVSLRSTMAGRSEKTVNTIITCVIGFFDYLWRLEDYNMMVSEKVKKMQIRFNIIESNPNYNTLVADLDGKVVGMAGLCTGLFYEFDGSYVRIVALVVDSNYRRKGIGFSKNLT